jgi:hypothetical protein
MNKCKKEGCNNPISNKFDICYGCAKGYNVNSIVKKKKTTNIISKIHFTPNLFDKVSKEITIKKINIKDYHYNQNNREAL